MSTRPAPPDPPTAAAEGKLERLRAEVEALQAVLVRLLQEVVLADRPPGSEPTATLVEANAHLVEATLESRARADAAAEALQRAERAAVHDALTQLPNRNQLVDRFEQAAAHVRRRGASRLALLFVDLDDFKRLNDSHGHAFGDLALRQVAERLAAAVREEDTVSRYGGDEFVVLLADLQAPGDARAVARKLIAAVGAPLELAGHVVTITASVGIALYPDDGEDLDHLIAHADAAMYRAKREQAGGPGAAAPGEGPAPPQGAVAAAVVADPRATGAAPPAANPDPERAQADLREANERLVLAVLSAQELREAAEAARQRQTAFLAAVAEELSRPGAPIRVASAMLGRPAGDPQPLPYAAGIVQRQLAQVSRLVSRVIEASTAGHGPLRVEPRRIDLAAVVDRAVAAHRPLIAQRGQQLKLQLDAGATGACVVLGDAAQLEHAIGNLLDNARTHTPEGGRIGVALRTAGDTVSLTVLDDGIGITPQMLPHIFEPFVQDSLALGAPGVGPGVGLTVARALVQAHGGRLEAHSAGVHRGSRFVMTLPKAGARVLAATAPIAEDTEG